MNKNKELLKLNIFENLPYINDKDENENENENENDYENEHEHEHENENDLENENDHENENNSKIDFENESYENIITIEYNNFDKKYMEPTIIQNINFEKYFTKDDIEKSLLNNKKLKITDKGLYSISKHQDAKWISEIIKKFLKSENINTLNTNIIDATAGIGGNTISFAKYFNKVYSIEINSIHYDVLNNNVEALLINNVTTYLDNFFNLLDSISNKSNIFFLDPPWGGKNYKKFKYFNLKIGKLPIYNVLNMLFDKKYKYVILKAPYNLNLSPIYLNIKYENMCVQRNFKKNMIISIFY